MSPFGIKLMVAGIVLVALAGMVWRYEAVVTKAAKIEIAVAEANAALHSLEQSQARIRASLEQVDREMSDSRVELDKTRKLFARHDFGRAAASKPTLVTKAMQRGTNRVFKELEDAANETSSTP